MVAKERRGMRIGWVSGGSREDRWVVEVGALERSLDEIFGNNA